MQLPLTNRGFRRLGLLAILAAAVAVPVTLLSGAINADAMVTAYQASSQSRADITVQMADRPGHNVTASGTYDFVHKLGRINFMTHEPNGAVIASSMILDGNTVCESLPQEPGRWMAESASSVEAGPGSPLQFLDPAGRSPCCAKWLPGLFTPAPTTSEEFL